MNFRAFITGSRCYGTPTPASDIDLVVRISPADWGRLMPFNEGPALADDERHNHCQVITIGRIHLICCLTDGDYMQWKKATAIARKKKPLSKSSAIKLFKKVFGR